MPVTRTTFARKMTCRSVTFSAILDEI